MKLIVITIVVGAKRHAKNKGETRNLRKIANHPNHSIAEIIKNTDKSHKDLRRGEKLSSDSGEIPSTNASVKN